MGELLVYREGNKNTFFEKNGRIWLQDATRPKHSTPRSSPLDPFVNLDLLKCPISFACLLLRHCPNCFGFEK